jgi:hypothetical protein
VLIEQISRVAWYRLRSTFGRRWRGYLTVVVLVGLIGGLAMAAVAAARRTQSSFPAFITASNPSDLMVTSGLYSPAGRLTLGYEQAAVETIAHLPHVRRVESIAVFARNVLQLGSDGAPSSDQATLVSPAGSVDGEFFTQDRVAVTQGRMADPARADEFVMNAQAASFSGLHLGGVISLGFYTNAQTYLPDFGTASVQPHLRVDLKLVGIVKFTDQVLQNDVDAIGSQRALLTPALTRQLTQCCTTTSQTGIQLDGGNHYVAAVEARYAQAFPKFAALNGTTVPSLAEAQAERAIKPEAVALGVFGAIAGLAVLLIAAQVIGRHLRLDTDDRRVLRALGASPPMTTSDGLAAIFGAVVAGALLAAGVAVGLSPLAPIGPVRAVYPGRGVSWDWTVLGLGVLVLIAALSALAGFLAYRGAPHRAPQRELSTRGARPLARAAFASGLPAPAVTGIRFALQPAGGRNTVPVRSAVVGAGLAVVVVVATVTFGASLHTLVSRPALYGWNWDYELLSAGGEALGAIAPQQAATALDPIAKWTGVYFATVQLDGQTVPALAGSPNAPVGPPLLSGHAFDAPDQIVLGAATMAQLHKHVGDTVTVTGITTPTQLRIVGTATMPTIGSPNQLHLSMGTGALLSEQLIPASEKNPFEDPIPGPNAIFVRFPTGANRSASYNKLQEVAAALAPAENGDTAIVESVQRPAEIVNYRTMGTTPALLGVALAAGAVSALGLTLIASVRRRRRDLALLKTLGFTHRQLAAVVAWQSTIAVTLGTAIGVPLGIALGRSLWDLFADEIHVVPHPAVPALTITLVTVGALVLANIVAAVPGRIAARTPTALLLRAE